MSIPFSPPGLYLINNDLVPQVIETFKRQFFIDIILDGSTLDGYMADSDGYYGDYIKYAGKRVLVIRNLQEHNYRDKFDMVMFAKAGLVSVLSNRYGPPNITLAIDRVYLSALINLQQVISVLSASQAYYAQWGNIRNFDFNPHHWDLPLIANPPGT